MSIFNLGSINIDNFYYLKHLPKAGETLGAERYARALGGKGANQSVAAALAGSDVRHIGAVGEDGAWCTSALKGAGVDVRHVVQMPVATGHANVYVDLVGENMIVLNPGANRVLSWDHIQAALGQAMPGDTLILQNEVNLVPEAARCARARGVRVIYSAAPFEADAARKALPHCDLLVVNEVEAVQLSAALGVTLEEIEVPAVLITRGAKGAIWRNQETGQEVRAPAFKVVPVDTTGAGDCFLGYFASGLDLGLQVDTALRRASAAAAIQVTREGTAEVIPDIKEVTAFLASRD